MAEKTLSIAFIKNDTFCIVLESNRAANKGQSLILSLTMLNPKDM